MLRMMIVLLLGLCMVQGVVGFTKFTPTSREDCVGSSCVLSLHASTMFVEEDKVWKRVDEARSLKGSTIDCVVVEDDKISVECLDYNMTTVRVWVTLKDASLSGKSFPVRFINANDSELKEKEQSWVIGGFSDHASSILPVSYGEEVHFGEKSTVLKLDDSKDLEDTYVYSALPNNNYATSNLNTYLKTDNTNMRPMLKFDIGGIPAGQVILNATLFFEVSLNGLDASTEGWNNSVWLITSDYSCDGVDWKQTCPTYTNRPQAGNLTDYGDLEFYVFGGVGEPSGSQHMSVNNTLAAAYALGYVNFSFMIIPEDVFGSPSGDTFGMRSKENGEPLYRPYINVTYSAVAGGDSCDPPASGTWFVPGGCDVTMVELADYVQGGEEAHLLVGDGDIGLT